MHDLSTVTTGDQNRALGISTLSFTVCFAVWTIFSIIGVKIKPDLGLRKSRSMASSAITASFGGIFVFSAGAQE